MPRLSVLIPAYNWSVTPLVRNLVAQIVEGRLDVDIHIFDDGSFSHFADEIRAQESLAAQFGVRLCVYRPPFNVGRSVARNELLARSQGELVLFLDADVLPDEPDFLRRYLDAAGAGSLVVCGGISYRQCTEIAPSERFYYRYSSKASVAPAETRNLRSWVWIFTANMMAARCVVEAVPFDQGFVGYGYEDIEWGIRLDRFAGIVHIDNPVTHLGLLSKEVLQRKMRESAPNLVYLRSLHPELLDDMQLVRLARRAALCPRLILVGGAALAGWMFRRGRVFGFHLEWSCFQFEKILRAALAFQRGVLL